MYGDFGNLNILMLIPGIKVVYKASRQFIDLLATDKEKLLMKPVLVEYPAPDRWSVGFTTGEMDPATSPDQTKKYYRVLFPQPQIQPAAGSASSPRTKSNLSLLPLKMQ
jgi:uncharacterized membrane protein